ncbi:Pentatricopeptide repeat-containing protein At1g61870, mitochondrial [Linum perenne]
MAFFSRLRVQTLSRRNFSTILSPDSKTTLSSKEKTRAALSLLKAEKNPEKILEICRAASLTPELHLDRIAFSVAISKLSESNQFSYIKQFIDELRRDRPDLRTERFAAHSIVLFGQANMVDDAIRTFKDYHSDLEDTGSVRTLNALLFACTLAKKYGEVKRIFVDFPRIYNIQPNLDTYNTVIKAFTESGSSSSVYSILEEMKRNRVKPNALSFSHLLAGFYKEEKFEDVGKVLDLMKTEHLMHPGVSTYNVRIQSLCKLKRTREAKALFDKMVSEGPKPNSVTYTQLIHGFCSQGDLEEAKKLFSSMVHRGCVPESDCYFTLIHFLCLGKDFETALSICKVSIEKKWVPNFATMKLLVNGLASTGKVEEAKELVGQMKEKFSKTVNLWEEVEAGFPQ